MSSPGIPSAWTSPSSTNFRSTGISAASRDDTHIGQSAESQVRVPMDATILPRGRSRQPSSCLTHLWGKVSSTTLWKARRSFSNNLLWIFSSRWATAVPGGR
jgi:hypothetical protein